MQSVYSHSFFLQFFHKRDMYVSTQCLTDTREQSKARKRKEDDEKATRRSRKIFIGFFFQRR